MAKRKSESEKRAAETERNLHRLRDAVEKEALAIAYRFGDIDNTMVTMADQLKDDVDRWIAEVREYIEEAVRDDHWRF
jgi:hypothetical protein